MKARQETNSNKHFYKNRINILITNTWLYSKTIIPRHTNPEGTSNALGIVFCFFVASYKIANQTDNDLQPLIYSLLIFVMETNAFFLKLSREQWQNFFFLCIISFMLVKSPIHSSTVPLSPVLSGPSNLQKPLFTSHVLSIRQ